MTRRSIIVVVSVALMCVAVDAMKNIMDFGAIADTAADDFAAATANGRALFAAVQAANADPADRTVLVPATQSQFAFIPFEDFYNLSNVTIVLDGVLSCYNGPIENWPNKTGQDQGFKRNVIAIFSSIHVTLTSNTRNGTIIGNGLHWWWANILYQVHRPNLIHIESCIYTLVEHWALVNSPRYHYKSVSQVHAVIQFVRVHVDVDDQKQMLRRAGLLTDAELPTFPLNTDGIDVRGHNITVRYCHVENFDDALCVKPSNGRSNLTNCTSSILFHDNTVRLGVGATIGSVPPDVDVNCVRDVTFRRITFETPLKAIYVKPNPCPNPATDGRGIIDNILYEDIVAHKPIWWSIWVSTQQQHQPGANGTDTGCSFLFPLPGHKCPVYPCVPVTRLKLRNVVMSNAVLSPGILRCDPRGPCTGWEWNNVTITSDSNWPVGDSFLCDGIVGAQWTNVTPGCVSNFTVSPLSLV